MTIKTSILSSISLLVLDCLWLYFFMGIQYRPIVLKIQKSSMKINRISAVLAYSFMILGLHQIVLKYKLSLMDTFIFGACVYAVYNFTCGAIFKDWNFNIAIIDILWGGFVYVAAVYIGNKLSKIKK